MSTRNPFPIAPANANAKNEKILAMSIIDIIENIAFFKKQGALNKGIEQGDLP